MFVSVRRTQAKGKANDVSRVALCLYTTVW